jgi:hypothetical protein
MMGLVIPGHLQDKPGPSSQWAKSPTRNLDTVLADSHQSDPQGLPAPYIDVPMKDMEEILDLEQDPVLDPSLLF